MPEIPLPHCTFYAFTDPASGRSRSSSTSVHQSKQAITVVAVSPQTHVFAVLAWHGKLPTVAYIEKLLKIRSLYNPKIFGIESNAMQSLFADVVRSEARRKLQSGTFLGINQPTNVDKKFRIRTAIEPIINYGRLFLLPDLFELEAGLRGFPQSDDYLDLVDCFASTLRLIPQRPATVTRSREIDRLAKYLRDTGSPAWYIEQRINEARLSARLASDEEVDSN